MNRAEEERLVAMYFDNSDFEKHAKETIKTLDQLKDSMNLEDSVKGFDMFDKMKRNAGLEQMQKSADKLKNTFSSIGTVLNKTFSIASGPLKTLENTFATIRGYVGKYLGFDFASKLVSSVEGMFRSLMIAPISDGWRQYENEIDSVQTIMSSTGRSIQDVTHQLDILTDYADKTVYSLSDMTSNIGKFTNNGVELEDATQAMMGIANAAAAAGQGTQQASMAMYNFSQAIGVGKMTSIDWKSIENANMATKELKNTFIEIAAAKNELKKIGEGEEAKFYYTKDSNGRELKDKSKWTEVTYKNFRETLSKGWLTSEAMTAALRIYSGENLSMNELVAMGIEDKDLQKKLLETGKNALEAAKQVRTFSKMMSSLKDAAASGWSRTFTLVFGNANEATTLWTSLSEKIGGAMDKSAAYRNKVLKDWKETREVVGTKMVDTGSTAGMVTQTLYGRNGREILIDSLNNILHIIGQIKEAFSQAFGDVFGTITGKDLFEKTQAFEKTTINIRKYFGELNDQGSRMNKIYRVIRGIISAFSLWKKSIRNLIDTVVRIFVPSFGGVLDLLANVGDFIYELNKAKPEEIFEKIGEKIGKVWEKIKEFFDPKRLFGGFSLGSLQELPAVTWLRGVYEQLKDAVSGFSINIGLGSVGDWLSGAWETVTGVWDSIKSGAAKALDGLGSFLSTPWNWIKEQLGLADDVLESVSGSISPIATKCSVWLEGAWNAVKTTYDSTIANAKNLLPEIGNFFSNPVKWIENMLNSGTEVVEGAAEGASEAVSILSEISFEDLGIVKWVNGIWEVVSALFGDTLPESLTGIKNNVVMFFTKPWEWLQKVIPEIGNIFEDLVNDGHDGKTGLLIWISNVWDKAKTFWNDTIVANASTAFEGIKNFFSVPWEWIKSALGLTIDFFTAPDDGHDGKTGFVAWISNVWDKAKAFWSDTIVANASTAFEGIKNFFSVPWEWIKSALGLTIDFFTAPDDGHDGKTGFVAWISNVWDKAKAFWSDTIVANASTAFEGIKEFFSEPWEWLKDKVGLAISFFKDPEPGTTETRFIKWIKAVWGNIESVWNEYFVNDKLGIFSAIGDFLSDTWGWIERLFASSASSEGEEAVNATEKIGSVSGKVLSKYNEVTGILKDVFSGESKEAVNNDSVVNAEKSTSIFERIIGTITKFLDTVKEFITRVTVKINMDMVLKFFDSIGTLFRGIITVLSGVFEAVGKYLTGEGSWTGVIESLKDLLALGVIPLIGKIGTDIIQIGVGSLAKALGVNMVSIGSELRDIGIAIALIMGTIISMKAANIEDEDITKFGKWILAAAGLLAIVLGAVAYFKGKMAEAEGEDDDDKPGAWERLGNRLLQALEKIGIIWIVMEQLPEVLRAAGEAKAAAGDLNYAEDLLLSLVGVFGAILVVSAGIALLSKLYAKGGSFGQIAGASFNGFLTMLEGVVIVLGTLWGINQLFPNVSDAEDLASKCEQIGKAIGGLVGGLFAALGGGLGEGLYSLSHGGLTPEEQAELDRLAENNTVDNILRIGQTLSDEKLAGLTGLIESVSRLRDIDATAGGAWNLTGFKYFAEGFRIFAESLLFIGEELTKDDFRLANAMTSDQFKDAANNLIDYTGGIVEMFSTFDTGVFELFGSDSSRYSMFFTNFHDWIVGENGFDQFIRDIENAYAQLLNEQSGPTDHFNFSMIDEREEAYDRQMDQITKMVELINAASSFRQGANALLASSRSELGKDPEEDTKLVQELYDEVVKQAQYRYDNEWTELEKANALVNDRPWRANGKSKEYYEAWIDRLLLEKGEIWAFKDPEDFTKGIEQVGNTHLYENLKERLERGEYVDPMEYLELLEKYGLLDGDQSQMASFDQFFTTIEGLYDVLDKHPKLKSASTVPVMDFVNSITNLLSMFGENGIGSKTWRENFGDFRKLVEDEDFVAEYVRMVEKIYEGLENSTLKSDEGITFDGVQIVTRLFEAIKDGFNNTPIPDINAQPVVDAIIKAVERGKTDLVKAIHEMIQAGIDETEFDPEKYNLEGTNSFTGYITEFSSMFEQFMSEDGLLGGFNVDDLVGKVNGFTEVLSGDAFTSALDGLKDSLPSLKDLIKTGFVDSDGKEVDMLTYFKTQMEGIAESFAGTTLEVKIQPTFDLTELTPLKLQEQLNKYTYRIPATVNMPETNFTYEGLKTALDIETLKQKLDNIASRIDLWGNANNNSTIELGTHMDGIGNKVSGMRLWIDGKALVGYIVPSIDRELGDRAARWSRTGTVIDMYN